MELALTVQVAIFIGALAFHLINFRAGLYHPNLAYLFFHGLVFVFRPLIVYSLHFNNVYQRMGFVPSDTESILTLLVADLGLAAFMTASSLVTWSRRRFSLPTMTTLTRMIQDRDLRRSFCVTAALLIAPVIWSSIHFMLHPLTADGTAASFGGTEMTRDAATGAALQTGSTAYVSDLRFLGGPLALGWAFLNRFRLPSLVPLGVYFFFRMCDGQGRFSFILLAAATTFVYLIVKRRKWPTFSTVALACVMMMVFSILGNDRHTIKRSLGLMSHDEAEVQTAADQRGKRLEDNSIFGPDFANYEYLNYVINNVPKQSGTYSYFLQYADLLIKPIPRMLWPGKPAWSWLNPVDLNSFGNFRALTVGLVGDGWISCGFIGVIITLSLCGLICGQAFNWFSRNASASLFVILGYCVHLSLTPQWFRDGGISIVEFEGTHLAPLFLWFVIYSRLKRQPNAARRRKPVAPTRASLVTGSPTPAYRRR